MKGKRPSLLTLAAVLSSGLALAVLAWTVYNTLPCRWQPDPAELRQPFAKLQQEIERERGKGDGTVNAYQPKTTGDILAPSAEAVGILRQLPGVAEVQVKVAADKPRCRIIHITDYHFVSPECFALDLKRQGARQMGENELALRYQEFQLKVELVQLEQLALLKCLARHHGLKEVWAEGVTKDNLQEFREHVKATAEAEKEVRRYLELLALTKKNPPEEAEQAKAELEKFHARWLRLGAVGQLLAAGDIEAVLPLDDSKTPAADKVLTQGGQIDPELLKAREDGMVKAVLDSGRPVAVIVLGGAHDLSASVRALGKGKCEYMRVVTSRYAEFVEQEF